MLLRTFFCLLICCAASAQAQKPVGVWEGSFLVKGSKKNKMNVRLELMETDTELVGVISARGYDKGVVYGCDYLVSGKMNKNLLRLKRINVRRGVGMSIQDCIFFQRLELQFSQNDSSATILNGEWIWADEGTDNLTFKKAESIVSESAKEEVESYIREMYASIEESAVLLLPEERLSQKAGEVEVDSTELVIDITSIEKNVHDSITVLLNGEPLAEAFNLHKKPLRIRMQYVQKGISDIVIINESQTKNKLRLQVTFRQKELLKEFTIEPAFVRNIMLLLVQKQE